MALPEPPDVVYGENFNLIVASAPDLQRMLRRALRHRGRLGREQAGVRSPPLSREPHRAEKIDGYFHFK